MTRWVKKYFWCIWQDGRPWYAAAVNLNFSSWWLNASYITSYIHKSYAYAYTYIWCIICTLHHTFLYSCHISYACIPDIYISYVYIHSASHHIHICCIMCIVLFYLCLDKSTRTWYKLKGKIQQWYVGHRGVLFTVQTSLAFSAGYGKMEKQYNPRFSWAAHFFLFQFDYVWIHQWIIARPKIMNLGKSEK